jgi:L-ascorbate metabolism protein UlaG (beta-lactamase superfamily)
MDRRTAIRSAALGTAALAVMAVGGTVWTRQFGPNRYYDGPERENFDGTRFRLPGAPEPRGVRDLLRWQLSGERSAWPAHDPSPFRDRPPRRVEGRDLRVAFVGHASFLIQTGGVNLLFDPVWSQRASPVGFAGPLRANEPGIAFDHLPPIDAVLVTHNHYDHLDLATLEALRGGHRPRFLVPLGNDTILRREDPRMAVEALDWGEAAAVAPGVRAHLVPSVHWSARSWNDRRHALWGSWVLETPGGPIYLVGDTGFGDGETFREVGRRFPGLRLALLPIGAYEPRWFMAGQHVNPDEAVQAMELCAAETALGHHWGTFQLTDEAIREPALALEAARGSRGLAEERFPALRPGQVWEG